jgi:hypothetical protein
MSSQLSASKLFVNSRLHPLLCDRSPPVSKLSMKQLSVLLEEAADFQFSLQGSRLQYRHQCRLGQVYLVIQTGCQVQQLG